MLRGPDTAPRPLDARALAALAANPGCRRRALMDAAGRRQGRGRRGTRARPRGSASRGSPSPAATRSRPASRRTAAPNCCGCSAPSGSRADVPELGAAGPEGRAARTRLALAEARARRLDAARPPAARAEVAGVHRLPGARRGGGAPGRRRGPSSRSSPSRSSTAPPTRRRSGAAARQAAVYVLALDAVAEPGPGPRGRPAGLPEGLLQPPHRAPLVDVRKQLAVTRRQLRGSPVSRRSPRRSPRAPTFDARARPPAALTAAVRLASRPRTPPSAWPRCELRVPLPGGRAGRGRRRRARQGGPRRPRRLTTVDDVLRRPRRRSATRGPGGPRPAPRGRPAGRGAGAAPESAREPLAARPQRRAARHARCQVARRATRRERGR